MSLIQFEQQGPLGTLAFNHPQNLNAMTPEMGEAIEALVPQLNANAELRVLRLVGAGRAFSAGGNLQFISDHTRQDFETNRREMTEFYAKFLQLRKIEVPTLAVIHGAAVGAGFLIALACDLRYASSEARFSLNFAKLGLSSGMGGLYWLTRLCSPAIAAELLFSAKTFGAQEAHTYGLLNGVYAPDELEAQTLHIARSIASNAPLPLKIMKQGLQAAHATLEEVLAYEAAGQARSFATEDLKEGLKAIQEKRMPRFTGE